MSPIMLRSDLLPPTGTLGLGAAVGRDGNAAFERLGATPDDGLFTFSEKIRGEEAGAGPPTTDDDEDAEVHGVDLCGWRRVGAAPVDAFAVGAVRGNAGNLSSGRSEGPAAPGTDDEVAARATRSHT